MGSPEHETVLLQVVRLRYSDSEQYQVPHKKTTFKDKTVPMQSVRKKLRHSCPPRGAYKLAHGGETVQM